MIRAVTYYQAVCDFCGKVDEEGDYSAWSDHGAARDNAICSDWTEWRDVLICWGCQTGELTCESCGQDDVGWAGNCLGCWEKADQCARDPEGFVRYAKRWANDA